MIVIPADYGKRQADLCECQACRGYIGKEGRKDRKGGKGEEAQTGSTVLVL